MLALSFFLVVGTLFAEEARVFRAGAAAVEITPTKLPIVPIGNFFPTPIDNVMDPLFVRSLVLDDGRNRIAFLVIDCCTIPKVVADKLREGIVEKTGIPGDRIMIAATHTHSAPGLRIKAIEGETRHTLENMVEAVVRAQENLEPAKIGWAVGNNPHNVFCRRFLMKEGTAWRNPFGGTEVDRAQMNPGYRNPNVVARTGPVDTAVSVVSILAKDDRPLALLANYSTHYAGVPADRISGDYFGVFSRIIRDRIAEKVGKDKMHENFLGILTNGTSGDANCLDFLDANQPKYDIDTVAANTADAAMAVWPNIRYDDWVPIDMKQRVLTLNNRLPTPEEIRKAGDHIAKLEEGKARVVNDLYAFHTVAMENYPKTSDVIVQAIRIGELGLATLPGEFYGITGLEIKARSPFVPTINLSQANGSFGYVPPAEQHRLGGYNVWRRPGNCLEPAAEETIRTAVIEMLKELDRGEY